MTVQPPVSKAIGALSWVAMGPVTGLLMWRMFCCTRNGDKVLAALYALAIISTLIALGSWGGQILARLSS
jgi:hypothetical protein